MLFITVADDIFEQILPRMDQLHVQVGDFLCESSQ